MVNNLNGGSRFQKTTHCLIAAGVKQINSLGVNIWCDNKLQNTVSGVLTSQSSKLKKDTFGQKNETKRTKKEERISWLRILFRSAGMLLKHIKHFQHPGSTIGFCIADPVLIFFCTLKSKYLPEVMERKIYSCSCIVSEAWENYPLELYLSCLSLGFWFSHLKLANKIYIHYYCLSIYWAASNALDSIWQPLEIGIHNSGIKHYTENGTQKPNFLTPGYECPKLMIGSLIMKYGINYNKILTIMQVWAISI